MLRKISNYNTDVLPVIPDGFFGRNTYASVQSYQESNGVPITGTVTEKLWYSISNDYHRLYPKFGMFSIVPTWHTNQILDANQANYHVFLLQGMLTALSYVFGEISKPDVNGVLDEVTQSGIKWVQQAANMNVTGLLDRETWFYVINLYHAVIGNGSSYTG